MDIIGQTISGTSNTVNELDKDFKKYSMNSNLIVMAAAVCIGIATKDIIEKLMNDVILPIITLFAHTSIPYLVYKKLLTRFKGNDKFIILLKSIGTTIWLFLVWSVIVFASFVMFKKLLDKNLISQQLGMFNKAAQYAKTLQESFI